MTFYIKIGLCLLAVLSFFAFKHHYDEGIRDEVRAAEVAPVKAAWEKDKADRLLAYSRMTTQWVVASQEAERLKKEMDDDQARRAAATRARVAAIPKPVSDVRIPVVAGVLNADDAVDGSGAPSTGAANQPGKDTPASPGASDDTTVGLWAEWSATMKDMYSSCRNQVIGFIGFYNGLLAKQAKEIQP